MDNRNLWELIRLANEEIKPMEIKRKERDEKGNYVESSKPYAEVKERVIAFRKVYPHGSIETEITSSENYLMCKATVKDEDRVLATGTSREYAKNMNALEVVETSAVGRALGFTGFGISTGIASAEEMQKADKDDMFEGLPGKKDLAEEFTKLYSNIEQVEIYNSCRVTNAYDMNVGDLQKYVNLKKYGKQTKR